MNATLLLVDDNPSIIRLLHEALRGLGQFYFATDGAAGLAVALARKPDIVLLDGDMPRMDGLELCAALKANPETASAAVIFVTAHNSIEYETRALNLGAADFVNKPISPAVVRARVRNHLNLKAVSDNLKRSNEDLEQFTYIIAHDLRGPLRSVQQLTEWIVEDIGSEVSPETIRNLSRIQVRTERLGNMLESLLKYSRTGHVNAAAELVDTAILVAEIVDSLIVPSGITVEIRSPLPVFRAIRSPLEHVLQNLISNALKHHDGEHGLIVISCRDIGRHIEFSVADDGPGVATTDQAKIFEIFKALKPSGDGKVGGVGLAIVKKAVEANGGAIRVVSNPPERGTEFIFTWEKKV